MPVDGDTRTTSKTSHQVVKYEEGDPTKPKRRDTTRYRNVAEPGRPDMARFKNLIEPSVAVNPTLGGF